MSEFRRVFLLIHVNFKHVPEVSASKYADVFRNGDLKFKKKKNLHPPPPSDFVGLLYLWICGMVVPHFPINMNEKDVKRSYPQDYFL